MTHTHCLEQETFSSIKEYVQFYASKVKSLSELKELIYEKFGLEYTINQIVYFQGTWTAEAYVTEKEPVVLQDDDYSNLIKLLQKNREDFLDYEYDARDSNLKFLFYSSAKMKETYLRNSDIVFINKRLTQNRFNRPIILFFCVSNTGQS